MTTYNDFSEVPVKPTKATLNMTVYLADEEGVKWIEVDGAHIRDEANEDYVDPDLHEFYELREEADENLHAFVENVCNKFGVYFEKIEDSTGDDVSYYYHIGDKKALTAAARKYVAENA
jgi:hypothetical protein